MILFFRQAADEVLGRVRVYAHKLLDEWHVPRDRGKWNDWQAAPTFAAAFDAVHRRVPTLIRHAPTHTPPPSPGALRFDKVLAQCRSPPTNALGSFLRPGT